MAKAEPGSAKDISNKIKARGLQRLRWYCQICKKQCRDDNGFKCHTESESHIRNALKLRDTGKSVDKFSHRFQTEFVYLLKASHGTKRVSANKVYGQYIQDKDHLHMNATRWKSLGSFVRSLERQGIVEVGTDEFGLNIALVGAKPTVSAPAVEERDNLQEQIDKAKEEPEAETEAETNAAPEPKPQTSPVPAEISFKLPKKKTAARMAPL